VKHRYYRAEDIVNILAVSRREAYVILHSFAAKGQLFRQGRLLRVRTDYFEQYLQDIESQSKDGISERFRKEA